MALIIKIENLNIYQCNGSETCNKECAHRSDKTTMSESGDEKLFYKSSEVPDGVYFYTTAENCWGMKSVDKCTEEIKGVAIIRGKQRIIVHPKDSDKCLMLLDSNKELSDAKNEDYNKALKDNDGYNTTEKLIALGSPAAKYCQSLGKEWYIPTLAEMILMYDHKDELNECLSKIGEELYSGWHWTSTRCGNRSHWVLSWFNGRRDINDQSGTDRVRPVSAFH